MLYISHNEFINGVTTTREYNDSPAITAEELKAALRVDHEVDAFMEGIMKAATQFAEQFLNRSLLTRKLTRQFDQALVPNHLRIERKEQRAGLTLMFAPVKEIERVYVVDHANNETDLESFTLDSKSLPPRALIESRTIFTGRGVASLNIDYVAGYGDEPSDVPALIRQGIIQHAVFLYEHRGDCDTMKAGAMSGAVNTYGGYRVIVRE